MNKYTRQLVESGIDSLLKTLDVLERSQDYEACAEIMEVIKQHNRLYNVQHPTRLIKEQIYLLK